MPRLALEVPHNLGREEATRRLKEKAEKARDQVTDLEEQWNDHTLTFRFKAMGFGVNGTMAVEDAAVKIDVNLPFAAIVAKGMIEQKLREELTGALA
jgi:putative polyhydroxyalkanoate system protein